MPRRIAPRMSDEQTWVLLNAPADVTDHQLASALGLTEAAVKSRRWTLRTKGWTCRVRNVTCLGCGERIILPPNNTRTDYPYHPECSRQAARQRVKDRRARDADLRQRMQIRGVEYMTEKQEASIQRAVNRGARWTESEDAWLQEHADLPAHELAEELGRTYYAVVTRRKIKGWR